LFAELESRRTKSGQAVRFFRGWKTPAAAALCAILLVELVIGLIFGLWPELDLKISGLFHDPASCAFLERAQCDWPLTRDPILLTLRDFNEFVTRAIVAVAAIALIFAAAGARSLTVMSPRVAIFLLTAFAAAPGLIANGVFKPHWGRPRPIDVTQFGGALDFVPWWSPFGRCPANCSFVSGEASSAFLLLAVAVLLPPRYRAAALIIAIVYGLSIGMMRVAMGGHFLSDVLFAGTFTALTVWVLHGALFRWRWRKRAPS
jgi:membrane-associated PAP2 superfamily phosphatase